MGSWRIFIKNCGVIETEVGYSNGRTKDPTYEEVCNNNTYFAETCLGYDENKVSLEKILEEYWSIIDPTVLNRQGNDVEVNIEQGFITWWGWFRHYTKKQRGRAEKIRKRIVTEVKPLVNYYKAEEYHQKYLKKILNGYCHIKL